MPSSFLSNLISKRRVSKRIKLINRFMDIIDDYKGLADSKEVSALRNRLHKELVKCQEANKVNTHNSKWMNKIPKDNKDIREDTVNHLEKWIFAKFSYLPNQFVKDLNEIKGKKEYTNTIQVQKKDYTGSINNKQSSVASRQKVINNNTVYKEKTNYEAGNKVKDIVIPDRSVSLYQADKVHSGKTIMRNNAFKSKVPPRVMRKANTI